MATARPIPIPPEAAAHALSPAALSSALRKTAAPPEVLRELMRRRPARLRETLEAIVADPSRPATLRTVATVGLGGLRDGRSIGALLTAAGSGDGALARRAIEALGRLGTPETLQALGRLVPPEARARKSLAFARSLIAYRHGLAGQRLAVPRKASITPLDESRALTLPVSRLTEPAWASLRQALGGVDGTLAPTDRPPLEIHCGKDRLLLLVNPAVDGQSPVRAVARPLVLAMLMKWSPTLDRWFIAEYIFGHPARGGVVQLVGARPTGTVVHTGTAVADGAGLRLELQALDSPMAAPTRVTAVVGVGPAQGVTLEALVEPDRTRNRHGARVPRPAPASA